MSTDATYPVIATLVTEDHRMLGRTLVTCYLRGQHLEAMHPTVIPIDRAGRAVAVDLYLPGDGVSTQVAIEAKSVRPSDPYVLTWNQPVLQLNTAEQRSERSGDMVIGIPTGRLTAVDPRFKKARVN